MEMDDENAPDDHGIFTALGTSHSSADGDFIEKSPASADSELLDQLTEDGNGIEEILEEVPSHDNQLTFRMTGLDEPSDEHGIEIVAASTAESDVDLADMARRQLNKLEKSRGKRSQDKTAKTTSPDTKGSAKLITMEIIRPAGSNSNDLIKSMQHRLSQKLESNFVTPSKPIPKVEFTGTIEIPKDLIIGTDEDIETATFIISDALIEDETAPADAASSLPDADLLAILEGNDEEAAVEGDAAAASDVLDKSTEMEVAMQQIMSLPMKRKGRPCKTRPEKPAAPAAAVASSRPVKAKNLVESLVQDWSGSDSDSTAASASQPVVKKVNKLPKKAAATGNKVVAEPAEAQPASFKRTRIIKKKVIWDPDAPETAISYASLVQPNAAGNKKISVTAAIAAPAVPPVAKGAPRILNKIPASQDSGSTGSRSPPLQAKRRAVATPPSPSGAMQRKRKVSEVDRLLGDEGAINMLNALKRDSLERDELNDSNKDDGAVQHLDDSTGSTHSPTQSQKSAAEHVTMSQRAVRTKRPQTPANAAPAVVVKKEPVTKRPKKTAAAASSAESWDYIYSNRNDDSLIIRRRSNSSYSSSASTNHRLSIDTPAAVTATAAAAATAPKSTKAARLSAASASFEFAKPSARKSASAIDSNADATTILMDIRSKAVATNAKTSAASAAETRRSKRGNATTIVAGDHSVEDPDQQPQLNAKERKIVAKLSTSGVMTTLIKAEKSAPPAQTSAASGNLPDFKEIELTRRDGVVHIVLQPFSGQLTNVFTLPMMREVCKALQSLTDDATCKVVLIASATSTFCNGLDYTTLLQSSSEKRRTAAEDLASGVSQFIESLASFPKTLIAAVHGRCVGLGVTILPLFDLVLAQKTSTFETPYARSGQLPEACSVLQLSTKVGHNAKTKLLLLAETLTVEMAHQSHLVTKILPANGFDAEIQRQVAAVADLSVQALDAMKAVAQSAELISLPSRMADEQKILQQHWSSVEWQDALKRYLKTEKW